MWSFLDLKTLLICILSLDIFLANFLILTASANHGFPGWCLFRLLHTKTIPASSEGLHWFVLMCGWRHGLVRWGLGLVQLGWWCVRPFFAFSYCLNHIRRSQSWFHWLLDWHFYVGCTDTSTSPLCQIYRILIIFVLVVCHPWLTNASHFHLRLKNACTLKFTSVVRIVVLCPCAVSFTVLRLFINLINFWLTLLHVIEHWNALVNFWVGTVIHFHESILHTLAILTFCFLVACLEEPCLKILHHHFA